MISIYLCYHQRHVKNDKHVTESASLIQMQTKVHLVLDFFPIETMSVLEIHNSIVYRC